MISLAFLICAFFHYQCVVFFKGPSCLHRAFGGSGLENVNCSKVLRGPCCPDQSREEGGRSHHVPKGENQAHMYPGACSLPYTTWNHFPSCKVWDRFLFSKGCLCKMTESGHLGNQVVLLKLYGNEEPHRDLPTPPSTPYVATHRIPATVRPGCLCANNEVEKIYLFIYL